MGLYIVQNIIGNQHNNGPYQDQIFDYPSPLCLALWAKIRWRWGWGVEGLMHIVGFV